VLAADPAPAPRAARAGRPDGGGKRTAVGRSPRILELLTLAETQPSAAQVGPYLTDPDPQVRRAAIAVLTEVAPPGAGLALADATRDPHGTVRHAALTGLRELAEVLPADDELGGRLAAALDSSDAAVRAGILDVLRQLRLGGAGAFAGALSDPDHRVRLQAVRGLVSAGEAEPLAGAGTDPSREVRIAVAAGVGTLLGAAAGPALQGLAADDDPLVRAAALKAAGAAGCPPPLAGQAVAALADPAWEVRVGAVQALQSAGPEAAAGPLARSAADPHPDVRKAAVIALADWAGQAEAAAALRAGLGDSDADVRAYARRALAGAQDEAPVR
jgi:HEAT repeat protein